MYAAHLDDANLDEDLEVASEAAIDGPRRGELRELEDAAICGDDTSSWYPNPYRAPAWFRPGVPIPADLPNTNLPWRRS